MVRVYTEEIDKLKIELKELKEQSNLEEDSMAELKDITSQQNISRLHESSKVSEMIMDADPMMSKISMTTLE